MYVLLCIEKAISLMLQKQLDVFEGHMLFHNLMAAVSFVTL